MDLFFCKLQKNRKINFVSDKFAKAKKLLYFFVVTNLKTLQKTILLSNIIIFTKGNLR